MEERIIYYQPESEVMVPDSYINRLLFDNMLLLLPFREGIIYRNHPEVFPSFKPLSNVKIE